MKRAAGLACMALAAAAGFAQQPRVTNARMETRAAQGLEAEFRKIEAGSNTPAWIGYAEPAAPGDRQMCCYQNGAACGCALEPRSTEQTTVAAIPAEPIKLEGATHLVILFRVADRAVSRVRTFSPDCALDAGGLPFVWLTGVSPEESVAWLARLARENDGETRERNRIGNSAVSAIALHAGGAADAALEQLIKLEERESLRRNAIFWLGMARGRRGYDALSRLLRDDPNEKIRERAITSLAQSKEPEALNPVLRAAHEDKSARVRGQALFWLAQKAGRKTAESAIADAIANDPETEVKKKAVFALTQMPASEGVPLLIQVARSNRNPEVRKQAMFWLGQSKDPRALSFFEEVLK